MHPRLKKVMRYAIVAAGLLTLVGALIAVKFLQISSLMAMGEEMQAAGPPAEAVGSAVAESQTWEGSLSAIGSVEGVKSVALSNDAPGRVTRVNFESGAVVKQGQVLVELDTSVERAQLASAKSRRDLALITAKRSRAMVKESVLAPAQLDNDEAQLDMATTDLAALQAQIDRKIVRAPFAGRLGIREVNVGQYLNPGTTLTTLEAVGAVFVDFTLPQQALDRVKDGMPVRLTFEGKTSDGVISAVDPTVDDSTRSVRLRASIPNEEQRLRPGMFVNVAVVLPGKSKVVAVPATAVVHASYGDSVFVIEENDGKMVVRQQFVKVGAARGDFVAIDKGLHAGEEVVSAGAFKLRNGAPVVVDNSVKPEPKLQPRPENR